MIAGVDGCRTGWIAAIDAGDSCTSLRWFAQFADILKRDDAAVIAVDIPIGLLSRGSRACDLLARERLGPRRGSSVFPAPIRAMLDAYACLWTAGRVVRGEAVRIPSAAELDERGLRAEIVT